MPSKSNILEKSPSLNNENKVYDVNKSLRNHSKTVFDLDEDSRDILKIISTKGPLIPSHILNHMGKINDKKEKEKERERIRKEANSPNGLVKKDYLYDLIQSKYKEGWKKLNILTEEFETIGEKKKKMLALTFKGFVASLATLEFEKNYMSKNYSEELKKWIPEKITLLIFHYIKCNIALILLWHKIHGINLAYHKHLDEYFIAFNKFNLIDLLPFFTEEKKVQLLIDEYINLRFQFLSTQVTLAKLLQSVEKKYTLKPLKSRMLNEKIFCYKSNTVLYSLIHDWITHLDLSSLLREKGHPFVESHETKIIKLEMVEKASQDLMNLFNLKIKGKSVAII